MLLFILYVCYYVCCLAKVASLLWGKINNKLSSCSSNLFVYSFRSSCTRRSMSLCNSCSQQGSEYAQLKELISMDINRSFSRDVITFQNLKLKIHQSFYPHQAKEVAYLYLFTILQLNSLLHFETRAFWISGFCGCVTHGDDRVCWKIYTYLMILSPFRSWSIRKRVYVNTCIFSTDNQSPR